ncbi:MAG TPA: Gfo/Idh/MocA family oxidoreductase [Opitutaceae bacterium]|nr:Gfo/Idh/MocA family oxidoreductase [Opitutaceae bacterium]HND60356.1 Gfo/Idh/MocA family oxidoreductase [Opitutaceae bacterium]
MLKVCVIGMGHIGNLHARIYRENKQVELAGVCDLLPDRAHAAAKTHGAKAYLDAASMLAEVRPDIVSITTAGVENGSDHHRPTIQALEAGAHVLCEKPICNDIAKAEEMVSTARRLNRCMGVDFNHRFTPAARVAKRWQQEGRLGHLLFVNVSMWIMNRNETSPWFHIKSLHPHTVDLMRHFCGDVEAVHCFATKAPGRKIWSTATMSLRFKNGMVGTLAGSYDIERGHPMERCEVAGTGGRFVIDDMWREVTLYPAGNGEKSVYTNPVFGGIRDFDDTFRNRINTFVEQIAAGAKPDEIDGSGADGLAAQKVLDAAVRSVETGQVISLT